MRRTRTEPRSSQTGPSMPARLQPRGSHGDMMARGASVPAGRSSMVTNDRSVQFAGGILGQQRHVCAFFNSIDEEHRVLRSFIKDGLDGGERAFHIVDPELREEHLKRLAEAGIDGERTMGTGQLEVRPWQ